MTAVGLIRMRTVIRTSHTSVHTDYARTRRRTSLELSRQYLRLAESEEIVITRHGKPAGVLIGLETEDDWFDYRLENDPAFLRRIEQARQSINTGKGVRLEETQD